MPTFIELQKMLTDAKQRQLIVESLIEHIDANFRTIGDRPPPHHLLDDAKQPVPEGSFESFIAEVLIPIGQECKEEVARVLALNLTPVVPAPPAEPAPQPQDAQVAEADVTSDKKRGKKK